MTIRDLSTEMRGIGIVLEITEVGGETGEMMIETSMMMKEIMMIDPEEIEGNTLITIETEEEVLIVTEGETTITMILLQDVVLHLLNP